MAKLRPRRKDDDRRGAKKGGRGKRGKKGAGKDENAKARAEKSDEEARDAEPRRAGRDGRDASTLEDTVRTAAEELRRRLEKELTKSTRKSVRGLERRLDDLDGQLRALRTRSKRLTRELGQAPSPGESTPDRGAPRRFPGPDGPAPVVSLEVPLETDDPAAPLWATVAARLPMEVTTVDDDGRIVRYRYSAVGSTPQVPRYRRLADGDEPF